MPAEIPPQSSKLKALVGRKKAVLTRTAFKLLPKTSLLLDWLLESTELSVAALIRTELEYAGDSYPFWTEENWKLDSEDPVTDEIKGLIEKYNDHFSNALNRIKSELPDVGNRRSIALDDDFNDLIASQAKRNLVSRDAWFNLLVRHWARNWHFSLEAEVKEAPEKKMCVGSANSMLQGPNITELKKLYPTITDQFFWKELETAWDGAEQYFENEVRGLLPDDDADINRKKHFIEEYDKILGKMS